MFNEKTIRRPVMTSPAFLVIVTLYLCCYRPTTSAVKCKQGTNCNLPECFCRLAGVPFGISTKQVPQMVVLALEGNLGNQRDEHYEQLLPRKLENPNGCKISATMFVPGQNTDFRLAKKWYDRGIEIALNSQRSSNYKYWPNISLADMKNEVLGPREQMRQAKIPRGAIRGYRNPALRPAGNTQYGVLDYEGFQYDASIKTHRKSISETIWPFTLKFLLPDGYCMEGRCPDQAYPGLWVVPSVPLINGTEPLSDSSNIYPYASEFNVSTPDAMSDFLWANFVPSYNQSRAPFIININSVGFLGTGGKETLEGIQQFIAKALQKPGVFFVSMHQMIEWMKNPAPLDKINAFIPWSCEEAKQEEQKGQPVNLDSLNRKDKSRYLFGGGRNGGDRSRTACLPLFLLTLVYIVFNR